MTKTVTTAGDWSTARRLLEQSGETLGFVPTMGAFHDGHLSLMERSLRENDRTVVSIFVNPTQFNDPNDLQRYPRPVDADRGRLEELGVDYLFLPNEPTVYPDGYRYRLSEHEVSNTLCGPSRPGHFDGVLTVVLRLCNIIRPHRAYFGEKDYQQYHLVRGMVEAFFLDIDVAPCPIVREADGLAMSSRNVLLSPVGRTLAASFARILRDGTSNEQIRRDLQDAGVEVDYVEEWENRRLAAVVIDGVRLIDNVGTEDG